MNIGLLREFIVVAECLNFHTAAARLYMTPSTLSRHIEAFERELGVVLLVRTTSHAELTKAGSLLLSEAPALLNSCDLLTEKCKSCSSDGLLRLGGFLEHPRIASLAAAVTARFRDQNPQVLVSATAHSACDYETLLLGRQVDLVFSPRYEPIHTSEFAFHDLFDLPVQVWVSKNSELAEQTMVSLRDIERMTFQLWRHPGTFRRWTSFVQQMFVDNSCSLIVGSGLDDSFTLMPNEYTLSMGFPTCDYYGSTNVTLDLKEKYYVTIGVAHKYPTSNPLIPAFVTDVLDVNARERE